MKSNKTNRILPYIVSFIMIFSLFNFISISAAKNYVYGEEIINNALDAYEVTEAAEIIPDKADTTTEASINLEIKNITPQNSFKAGSDAVVIINVKNNTDEAKDVTLIAALYDEYDNLEKYVPEYRNVKKGEDLNIECTIKIPEGNGYKLKAFIWDDVNNIKPLYKDLNFQICK